MSLLRQQEIALLGDNSIVALNGTSSVEVVAAPAVGFVREVRKLTFPNLDTAVVDIHLRRTVAGPTHVEFDNVIGLGVNYKFDAVEGGDVIYLTSDESITAVMGAAAATTNPNAFASWIDRPVPA